MRDRLACDTCGYIAYVNPRLVVSCRPVQEDTPGRRLPWWSWHGRPVGGEATPTAESLEVRAFAPNKLPWPHIAFQTTAWALTDWLRLRHPDVSGPIASQTSAAWPADSA